MQVTGNLGLREALVRVLAVRAALQAVWHMIASLLPPMRESIIAILTGAIQYDLIMICMQGGFLEMA